MQHEILERKPLLDENGQLTEPGFGKKLMLHYDRNAIKAPKWRIKEWDYYYIGNDDFGIALTVADNSYMGLDSISLLNFKEGWEHTASPMEFFTNGKVGFPSSSENGHVAHKGKHHTIVFEKNENERRLTFHMDNFFDKKPIAGEIILEEVDGESMAIATPFPGKKKHFYYNQKVNCMSASGIVHFDGREYAFTPDKSFAVLDWGRGVWTYRNTWYWGSASGQIDGIHFGFNIGYGFGDTKAASENMLFYDHKAHKLELVDFHIPKGSSGKEDYMKPWKFTSSDGRFEMDFVPVLDRHADTNVLLIRSNQHQVFGKFSGKAVLDDGTVVEIKDFMGFAEKVYNKW